MKNRFALRLLLIVICALPLGAEDQLTTVQIVERMALRAEEMDLAAKEWGYWQESVQKKLDSKNRIKEEEKKLRKTIWLEGKPYMELVKINDKDPDAGKQKEEAERKAKFLKSLHENNKKEESVTWNDLYSKYDFQLLPADPIGRYVFSFKPKPGKLRERSRSEKVLNHVQGTLWADEEFNIVRAEAKLQDNVRFALGILGNLEKLELKFEQQDFQNISVPSTFYVHFKARLALLKTEERQIQATYKDFFRRQK